MGVVLLRDSGAERGSGTGLLVESWLEVEEPGWLWEFEGVPGLFLAGLGNDRLAASLGYLEPPALSSRDQHSTKHSSKLLKQIHKQVATTTGTKVRKPIKLRRRREEGYDQAGLARCGCNEWSFPGQV